MLQPITKENFPVLISQYTTSELENLLVKFPYVREAHVLLAKKYQIENNPKFDQQLQLAVLYTDNRELLFNLFAGKSMEETSFEGIAANLEMQIQEVAPGETVQEQTEKEAPLEEIEQIETLELAPVASKKAGDDAAVKQDVNMVENFSPAALHTFDEWIKASIPSPNALKSLPTQDPELTAKQEDELNKTILENMPVGYLYEKVDEETHYSKGLDKFIEEQISKRKKAEPKKPVAQDDLDPELITETMAKIYEMQKKYTRAIRAYEILSLKFPEKNDFFAARINYLKNII